jgi:hypothetical protein
MHPVDPPPSESTLRIIGGTDRRFLSGRFGRRVTGSRRILNGRFGSWRVDGERSDVRKVAVPFSSCRLFTSFQPLDILRLSSLSIESMDERLSVIVTACSFLRNILLFLLLLLLVGSVVHFFPQDSVELSLTFSLRLGLFVSVVDPLHGFDFIRVKVSKSEEERWRERLPFRGAFLSSDRVVVCRVVSEMERLRLESL